MDAAAGGAVGRDRRSRVAVIDDAAVTAWANASQWVAHCVANVNTSSLKQTQSGWSALTGWFTWTMVRVGLTRPSTNPSWIPSASDNGSPRAKARPETTAPHPAAGPRRR